jgi:hypothetical protein
MRFGGVLIGKSGRRPAVNDWQPFSVTFYYDDFQWPPRWPYEAMDVSRKIDAIQA